MLTKNNPPLKINFTKGENEILVNCFDAIQFKYMYDSLSLIERKIVREDLGNLLIQTLTES